MATAISTAVAADDVQTLYGYQLSVPQWGDAENKTGFVSFTSTDYAKLNFLKTTTYLSTHLSAGEYVDGKIYGYTIEWSYYGGIAPVAYVTYDANTYAVLTTKSWEDKQRVLDMTYDYTTNTMYALAEDEVSSSETTGKTSLYIVDMETGELSHVGDPGDLKGINGYNKEVDNHLVTIAADNSGNLFAMSEYRKFYSINKYTGKATQIGDVGKVGVNNEFQSMCFGTDGKIYWAQKHPDYGYLSTIDSESGVQTKLGTLGENAQVTCLYVKRDLRSTDFPLNVTNLKATNEPGTNSVKLSWKLPTHDYAGNAVNITAVRVLRLGSDKPVATLAADATEFTDNNAANGTNCYNVVAYNGNAAGRPATVSVFAGTDQLEAVHDLHAVKADDSDDVTITWTPPTETVNDGYADFSNITYNVYRVDLITGNYIRLSEKQTALSYVDKSITSAGVYCYVVEPVCAEILGLAAQSEDITIAATYTAPVTFTFENNADAYFWTAKNNHTNAKYGWMITAGAAYQRLDGNFAKLASGGSADPCDDWLISPAIELKKGTYYLNYHASGTSYGKISWEVFVGEDNTDTSKFTTSLDRHENETVKTWTKMDEKSFTVDHDGTYYLGIHGFTTDTYASAYLDNISISDVPTSGISNISSARHGIVVEGDVATVSAERGIASWTITNVSGQAVLAGNGDGATTAEISLSSLNAGVYIVMVKTIDGARFTDKILVK